MTRVFGLALVGCAMGAASLVAARDRPAALPSKVDVQNAATLARLIYPEALNRAIVSYTMTHIVAPAYHADPSLQALEAAHPGIIDAMIAAMRPEFERGRREALPRLWAETAAVYAAGLTPDELRHAVAFHNSPAGRRLAMAEQAAVAHASPPSNRAGSRDVQPATATPDDIRAKGAFDATAAGRKLAALRPRIEALTSAWNNAPTPEADARVSEAMSKAADRFYDSEP
jgi:hypothetical protein